MVELRKTGGVIPDLTALLDVAAARPAPRVVAVDGRSGAGKTTFADAVADDLQRRTGDRPQVVHMDDVYEGWAGLAAAPGLVARWVLEPLAQGRPARFRRWDWAADARGEWLEVPAAEWVVLEGVGAGSRACRPHLAALVWLDADEATRRDRALARDGEMFRPHWDDWRSQELSLFATEGTRDAADLVVDSGRPGRWLLSS